MNNDVTISKSGRILVAITIISILILGLNTTIVLGQQTQYCGEIVVKLNVDGSVEVTQQLDIEGLELPATINITLLSTPIFVEVKGLDTGELLPFRIVDNTTLSVTIFNDTRIQVYYVTTSLTSKQNLYWTLEYSSQCETILIMAAEIVPLRITPSNPTPVLVNGTAGLKFPPGNVSVDYYVVPGLTTTPPETTTTSTPASPSQGINPAYLAIALLVALVLAGGYWFTKKRKGGGGPITKQGIGPGDSGSPSISVVSEALDERDRLIIDALKTGPKTASELMDLTGIPKTPLYRRLRKLIDRGIIEYKDEGGSRKYMLKTTRG
ncbi:MAG: winged helix-turn-helix domain-containing protein [Desulfurococcales archaeon]|nr:winged helix-turn-helix domain-containing protein [Desulfurococcales archaeon]